MVLLGIDVSHWQGNIDWPKVKAAGHAFAILKATESTNYVDPTFAANRAKARAAGIVTGAYHFARAGDPVQEADHFVDAVDSLAPGELAVLDWEVPASNPPAWCKTWLDRVTAALGVRPLIYMNQSAARGSNWSSIAGFPLWLAKYDLVQTDPGPIGAWPRVAIKQFSDKGTVPGIAGGVDMNVLYGDKTTLAALGRPGTDGGFLMSLTDPEQREILAYVREHRVGIPGQRSAGKPGGMMLHGMEQALGRIEVKLAAVADDTGVDVAALVASLRPVLAELVEKVREAGADADADAIVDELLERLAAGSKPTT